MTERPDVEKQPRRDLWHIPRERLLEYVMHLAIKGNWREGARPATAVLCLMRQDARR